MNALKVLSFVAACAGIAAGMVRGDEPASLARPVLKARRLVVPIVVDGTAAEWPGEMSRAAWRWTPTRTASAAMRAFVWDADFLYVVFEVASGKELRNAGDDPATAFKTGDTVELFLSVNERPLEGRVPRGPDLDTAKPGDYRVLMTLLRNTRPIVFGFDFVNPARGQNPLVFQIAGPRSVVDLPPRLPEPHSPRARRLSPASLVSWPRPRSPGGLFERSSPRRATDSCSTWPSTSRTRRARRAWARRTGTARVTWCRTSVSSPRSTRNIGHGWS